MNRNDFFRSIEAGRFERVYLFAGPEELSKRRALEALRSKLLPPGLEQLNEGTLENCSAQAIIDAAETLPAMCERRLLVVRDWGPLTAAKAKNETADAARMQEWLSDPPETCALVFYMGVELGSPKSKKLVAALTKLPGYVNFDYLSGAELAKWCNQRLRPLGKRISADAVAELTMMAGQELVRIQGELEKLAAYAQDAEQIDVSHVRAVVTPSPEYQAYAIIDHLLAGRHKEATEVLNAVLTKDEEAVPLIALFANQLRIDAHYKYAMETGASIPELLKALNINEYRARHVLRQVRAIPADALRERYLACVEADYAIKSGSLRNRAALDMLMLKLTWNPKATKVARASSKS